MPGLLAGTKWDRPPHCERCDRPQSECVCPPLPAYLKVPAEKQTARVALEKRAKGKMATVIRGLLPNQTDLELLAAQLKAKVGAGGGVKEDTIEIQGKQVERVAEVLKNFGYRIK